MTKQTGCISDLEKLKEWFFRCQATDEQRPYFTIFRGSEAKDSMVIYRNSDIGDPAEAWEAMEEILNMHSEYGGIFRIYITKQPRFNVGLHTLYRVNTPAQVSGIQGLNGGAGGFGIYGSLREYIEEEKRRDRELYDLKQQMKDMQREQDAKVGEMDNMIQEFMPIVKDLAHKFGLKMMGFGSQPAPADAAHHAPADPSRVGQSYSEEGYDYDRVEPALDKMRTVFPDTENTLEKLAQWATENPEMARSMMQNL